jgi:hypothetical protein
MSGSPSVFRATPADHAHPDQETCPYCEQPVANDRAVEIRARFEADARRQTATIQARIDEQLKAKVSEFEAEKKSAIEKAEQDKAAAIQLVRDEAAEKQRLALEQGKKAAELDAREKIEAAIAERDALKQKNEQTALQNSELAAQITTLKESQEAVINERTKEVREAFEKHEADKINEINAKHTEEMTKRSEELKALQQRLAVEEHEGANLQLLELLKAKFPRDDFQLVTKPNGADIIHVIKHNKKPCGKIVYDSRNRNRWDPTYAANLRKDMVSAEADYALLTSSKFPKDVRQIHCQDEVIVANPARVFVIVEILRREIIRNFGKQMSTEDRSKKSEKLYGFITSDAFNSLLGSVVLNYEKLLRIDEDEVSAHRAVWKKRGQLLMATQTLHSKLREKIDDIIGTGEAK